jgi:hypothetical protein
LFCTCCFYDVFWVSMWNCGYTLYYEIKLDKIWLLIGLINWYFGKLLLIVLLLFVVIVYGWLARHKVNIGGGEISFHYLHTSLRIYNSSVSSILSCGKCQHVKHAHYLTIKHATSIWFLHLPKRNTGRQLWLELYEGTLFIFLHKTWLLSSFLNCEINIWNLSLFILAWIVMHLTVM